MKYAKIILLCFIPSLIGGAHVQREYKIIQNLPEVTVRPVDENEVNLLARLVASEDNNQPFESNLVVAQTVLNKARRTGNSIKEVIYKRYVDKNGKISYSYYGRFNKVWKKNKPKEQAIIAAKMILSGYEVAPRSVEYFIGANDPNSTWVRSRKDYIWQKIGYHTYCHNEKSPFYKKG